MAPAAANQSHKFWVPVILVHHRTDRAISVDDETIFDADAVQLTPKGGHTAIVVLDLRVDQAKADRYRQGCLVDAEAATDSRTWNCTQPQYKSA